MSNKFKVWSVHGLMNTSGLLQSGFTYFARDSKYSCFLLLLDFTLTVKAAPHECVIRTSQP